MTSPASALVRIEPGLYHYEAAELDVRLVVRTNRHHDYPAWEITGLRISTGELLNARPMHTQTLKTVRVRGHWIAQQLLSAQRVGAGGVQ